MRAYECAIDEADGFPPPACCTHVTCLPVTSTIRAARCVCGCGVTEAVGQRIYTTPEGQPYWWQPIGGEA